MSITTDDQTPDNDAPSPERPEADPSSIQADGGEAESVEAAVTEPAEPPSQSAQIAAAVSETVSAEQLLNEQATATDMTAAADEDDTDEDDADDEDDDEAEPVESPYDRPGEWFVVHSYAGYENKVKSNLESRIASMNMEESIYEAVIPMEDVVEFKNGKKVVVQKKVFPGYLLVRCHLDDASWQVIRNTPGVTGFVSGGSKPAPLSRRDVETFLQVKPEGEATRTKTRPRLDFELGESVRVREGPFADFSGAIAEIDEDRLKLKVLVNIFGRETPVELDFNQIAKL